MCTGVRVGWENRANPICDQGLPAIDCKSLTLSRARSLVHASSITITTASLLAVTRPLLQSMAKCLPVVTARVNPALNAPHGSVSWESRRWRLSSGPWTRPVRSQVRRHRPAARHRPGALVRLRLQDEHEVSAAARITAPSRWTIVASRTPPRRRRDGLIHRSRSTQAPDHRGDAPPLPRRGPVDAHVPRRRQGEPLHAHGRQPRRVHQEVLRVPRRARRGLQQPPAPRAPAAPQGVLGGVGPVSRLPPSLARDLS